MSKSKLIRSAKSLLGLQSTYKNVECALWHHENFSLQSIPKEQASSLLIPTLDLLLSHHDLSLDEIAAIIVNQGPGPFTTLRTVITTANGINLGSSTPLIGVNGLEALLDEYMQPTSLPTVALLNAFHESVYYGIQEGEAKPEIGFAHIDALLAMVHDRYPTNVIRFLGNGTELYKEKIIAFFQSQAYVPEPLPAICSLEKVMQLGAQELDQKNRLSDQLSPIYLKQPVN